MDTDCLLPYLPANEMAALEDDQYQRLSHPRSPARRRAKSGFHVADGIRVRRGVRLNWARRNEFLVHNCRFFFAIVHNPFFGKSG